LVAADGATAARLHADDLRLINPAGTALPEADYLGGIASGDIDYRVFEPTSRIAVRLYGEAAVIHYQSRTEIVAFGRAAQSLRGWHTDVYERHDGHWQVVWSQMDQYRGVTRRSWPGDGCGSIPRPKIRPDAAGDHGPSPTRRPPSGTGYQRERCPTPTGEGAAPW
jgi:hypothetical protein